MSASGGATCWCTSCSLAQVPVTQAAGVFVASDGLALVTKPGGSTFSRPIVIIAAE